MKSFENRVPALLESGILGLLDLANGGLALFCHPAFVVG